MPQISVIVPVYKVEPYLRRCVESILAQTFTDFELILVDDGSPDNCPAICDEYKEKDSRVVVIHQKNGGLSAARNAGIDWAFAKSDSEWLFFVDSDDWIHPKSLEALMNGAEQTGPGVVIGGFERTDGESLVVATERLLAVKWDTEVYFREHNVNAIVAWGKLYKKRCFQEIRYPVGKIHEDEFTTYKILFKYHEIAVIDQPLYAYYQNSQGIMGMGWGTRNLVILEAKREQIAYFRKRKLVNLENMAITDYTKHLIIQCRQAQKQNDPVWKELYRQYRWNLLRYHTLFPFEDNKWLYQEAFPRSMHFYWTIKSIKEKRIKK